MNITAPSWDIFRHESGHYYWNRLIRDTEWLGPCRELFDDETLDYSQALERHYQAGPPADWQERFVSAYAASHPWEDWAEPGPIICILWIRWKRPIISASRSTPE